MLNPAAWNQYLSDAPRGSGRFVFRSTRTGIEASQVVHARGLHSDRVPSTPGGGDALGSVCTMATHYRTILR